MSMKMVEVPRTICVQFLASMLLLSSCGGGNSAEENPPEDDCTPTITTSTSLELEVGIYGGISMVPVANNSVSGCESTTGPRNYLDSSRIVTRFETTEDFDVWSCIREDGSSLHYALLDYSDFVFADQVKHYGFEIDPSAADLFGSQQLYAWRAPYSANGDMITLETREKVGQYNTGVQSEWTEIAFSTVDSMSVNSSTDGPMQCNRTISNVDLAASRLYIPCKYRGPLSAC